MKIVIVFTSFLVVLICPFKSFATCDSCFLPRTGRDSGYSLGADSKGLFFDVRYEYQNWDTNNTSDESSEHEDDHEEKSAIGHEEESESEGGHEETPHGHNRSSDRLYHLSAGYNFSDQFSVLSHIAFIERFELQESGSERSEGFSDLSILGTWRAMRSDSGFFGPVLGIKLPTGTTSEKNSLYQRFGAELQPGTGSTDVILGAAFEKNIKPLILRGNALYFLRTEGSQDYEFGDTTSLSLFADLPAYSIDETILFTGVDLNFQHGEKDTQDNETVGDSGASVLFLGPNITLRQNQSFLISAAVLFPVVQERGGNHQDVESIFTIGGRVLL